MIPDLVMLDTAKRHLRVEDSDHDADIAAKIRQASEIVLNYLKRKDTPADWPSPAPPLVQAATLLELSELYYNREASNVNLISEAVVALLERYRDPTLA
jgi:hypothetical protein